MHMSKALRIIQMLCPEYGTVKSNTDFVIEYLNISILTV